MKRAEMTGATPTGTTPMTRRLQISGILIVLGLLVEGLSFVRIHPLAFLGFMFVGGGLLLAGIAIYLYSLVSVAVPPEVE